MMKAIYLIILNLTILSGCNKQLMDASVTNTTVATAIKGPFTYLALGDSYTIGESVPQLQSFPYQLTNLLNEYFVKVTTPTIIATTGWTTDNLINAIAQSNLHGNTYDLVTLLIGVNDQYQGLSQSNYRIKFAQVLHTAISFAKGDTSRVFVLSIPDYGVTPFATGRGKLISPEIDQFNAINKDESLKAGVYYVDITPITKQVATDPSLVAADGLHPSGKMYGLWVNLLEPVVKARLDR
jgi:lysophospholipase L1-like esterase